MSRERLPVWQVPVTEGLDNLLEKAVAEDTHVSKSDLIRDAVRQKLAAMGYAYEKEAKRTR